MKLHKLKQSPSKRKFSISDVFFTCLVSLYALGTRNFEIPIGIDPSYEWVVTDSFETGKIFHGGFFGTYGPLGFLDFNSSRELNTKFLSVVWAVSCYLFFFRALWRELVFSKVINSEFFAGIFCFIVILITERFITTSLLFVFWMLLTRNTRLSMRKNFLLSIAVGLLFYIKFLPFIIGFSVLVFRLLSSPESQFDSKNPARKRHLLVYAPSLILPSLILFFDGLRTWFRGSVETLLGYSAMAGHPENSVFVLLLYICSATALILIIGRDVKSRILFIFVALILLSYGFQRQDQGHLLPAFFFLMFLPLAGTPTVLEIAQKKLGFPILGGLSILALSVMPKAIGPGFIKWDLVIILIFGCFAILLSSAKLKVSLVVINLTIFVLVTVQSPFVVVRELFSSYPSSMQLGTRIQESVKTLKELSTGDYPTQSPTPENIQLADSLKSYKGLIIATNNIFTAHESMGVEYLPVPMLFGAFTPWLDQKNVSYIEGQDFDFVLIEANTPIDGNTWVSEAPATALYLFCNYAPASHSEKWLLLYHLSTQRCSSNKDIPNDPEGGGTESITLANLETNHSIPGQHIFTDSDSYIIDGLGKRVGIQPKNSNGIMVAVPQALDYPEPWNINGLLELKESEKVTLYDLPLR